VAEEVQMTKWVESVGQLVAGIDSGDEHEAREVVAGFQGALRDAVAAGVSPHVVIGDVDVALGDSMTDILMTAVSAVRAGGRVALVEAEQLMSPEEAAKALGVSRPTVYQMLDAGELPTARTHGNRRQIRAEDVLAVVALERRMERADALAADAVQPSTLSRESGFEDMREAVLKAKATGDANGVSSVMRARAASRVRRATERAGTAQKGYRPSTAPT
jgi:excisionase family DNA binding protein